ncbi:MAG: Gfo/Idh/MocA family oxidoreductase [Candidatus Eisenbacteria sp.]|nr:Gfo/Idh/MocA family oxidoreductase [Candidatus Eisenbacteria bacterium]
MSESSKEANVIRVGVVGCGYWGPNLVRNFSQIPGSIVPIICDLEEKRLKHVQSLYPFVDTTTRFDDMLENHGLNAVCVATPVRTHFGLVKRCLEAGKHVLCEKPLTRSVAEAEELLALAQKQKCVLMAGHTFVYTAAVNKIKDLIVSGELGEVFYISTARVNLGLFQEDINVLWDLAPHDVSIMNYILDSQPVSVAARGAAYIQKDIEDVAFMTLEYPNGVLAHIHVSWLDPCKIRRTTVVGSRKMLVYDDVVTMEKIRVYDKGVNVQPHYDTFGEFHLAYRFGDIFVPRLDDSEPLKVECSHFLDCINNGVVSRSGGPEALAVVRAIEGGNESLKKGGGPVKLDN